MEWKPAEGDMPRVTFRTNINVLNIILVILIITINVFVYVEVCVVLCCLVYIVLLKECRKNLSVVATLAI